MQFTSYINILFNSNVFKLPCCLLGNLLRPLVENHCSRGRKNEISSTHRAVVFAIPVDVSSCNIGQEWTAWAAVYKILSCKVIKNQTREYSGCVMDSFLCVMNPYSQLSPADHSQQFCPETHSQPQIQPQEKRSQEGHHPGHLQKTDTWTWTSDLEDSALF